MASRRRSSTPVYPVPPTTPTLIIRSCPHGRNDKAARGRLCRCNVVRTADSALALGELLPASRLVQADLLALDLARVARDEARLRQRGLERGVVLDQRARDAVAHRAGLAGLAAAEHVHLDVERLGVVGELERLAYDHAAGLAGEEDVHGLVVDDDLALARLDEDAGHSVLATARAVVVFADHALSSRALGQPK